MLPLFSKRPIIFENIRIMNRAKKILYFGYGSNMSTQYLIKRRKIIPHESKVGVLKDYQLIMNMEGPNFLEPSFANIRNCKGVKVEGVVHEIDEEDLQKIVNTEGEDYKLAKLSVSVEGVSKTAYTLIYLTDQAKDIPSSRRYLKILIRAAKENKLSQSYIDSLENRHSVYYPILSEIFSLRVYLWVWLRT